jgi:ERCC4-type nuclease
MTLTIKIDTREQQPYEFKNSEIGTLSVGDYSICGLEDYVAIERKELNDLIVCLTADRERFEKELHKARALDYFALVIEASLSDLANGNYRSQMGPKSAIQSLVAFSIKYRLPIWFCESRKYAQRVTESLLCKYAREIEKKFELIK